MRMCAIRSVIVHDGLGGLVRGVLGGRAEVVRVAARLSARYPLLESPAESDVYK